MIILGIESTAHTFGIGIIKVTSKRNAKITAPKNQKNTNNEKSTHNKPTCTILANERALFTTKKGGMIPAKVAEHHIENIETVLQNALQKAKITISEVSLIAYSASPGIGHSLRIGAICARTLAIKLKKPIIGVNHLLHIVPFSLLFFKKV